MDQKFLSPTLLGFPLKLHLNATGSVSFTHEGTFEMTGPQNILVEGKLTPSTVMALDETLVVNGYMSSSGVRLRTTHFARTDIGGKFAIENGQVVDIKFDVPRSEVAKVSSSVRMEFFKSSVMNWEELRPDTAQEGEAGCSSESVSNIVGLKACRRLSSYTSVGGSSDNELYTQELTLQKTDTFEGYVFSFKKLDDTVAVLFDTPGSQVDRRASFQMTLSPDGARGSLVVPGTDMEGQYENTDTLKRLNLQYLRESELRGELDISLQMTEEGTDTKKYSPRFVLSLKDVVDINVSGSVEMGADRFMVQGNFMSNFQSEPANFQGKSHLPLLICEYLKCVQ